MSGARRAGAVDVAVREIIWIWRDKVALLLVIGIPLIAFALLATTFSNAVIRDLKVDVVDQDRSKTSETFVQAISSAPGVTVAERSPDLNRAMHSVRSGKAIAAVYIPQNLERDIIDGRRPQLVIFFNKQFFTPGNVASSGLQAAVSAAVADLPAGARSSGFTPGPLVVEQYVLTNPALNYAQFLLRAILPTVLHIIIAIAGGYAVGSEFGSRSIREWLATAGGSPLTALVGKLAPYFGIFLVIMAVGLVIIHGFFEVPFRGDPAMMGAAACLLIVGYLSLGALLQLLVKNLPFGLSLTGIVCSPAFGFAGVGFPVLAMNGFARGWGTLLPLRWYVQILFDQAARGVPVRDSAQPFIMLGGLAVLYFVLSWAQLYALMRHSVPEPAQAHLVDRPARHGIAGAFADEYGRVLGNKAAFGLIVLAPIIYGVFYPQPYLGQLIKDVPIAVVDDDNSDVSRTIIQALDADEATEVALRPTTLAEAQMAMARREVFGILGIPAGTEREVLKGDKASLPAFVDSTYFLLYNRTFQGIQEAVGAVKADLAARSARPDGSLYRAALAQSSPVEILNQPLFNPTGGYGSYIVPAAFLLILQQTLLMGSATLGGQAFQQGGREARRQRGAVAAVLGQSLAHLVLALPGFALFLVVLPRVYGFSASDRILDLLVLAIPYILSVSFLGQFVGSWFKRPETAVLLLVAISLPIFFQVGVAWPVEAIPPMLRTASVVLPSTSGIDGLVRVNQMGASLADVSHDWMRLWALTGVYALLAIVAARIVTTGRAPMPADARSRSVMVACAAAAMCAALPYRALGEESPQPPVPGMVRQTEIRIAPDTTGRLATIAVKPGDHVHKGDLLARLDNPELAASVGEARSAAASAKADRDKVYSGVRAEEVAIATQAVQTAETNLVLEQQQYDRAAALAGKDFVSSQELDEATASLAKAKADLELKRAEAAEAGAGPTAEERALADAKVAAAKATGADLQAQLDKTVLTAPVDGTIGIRVAEPGEIIGPGKPVMTLEADGQQWFAFTLREDALHGLTIGATVQLSVQDGRNIDARVTELRPLGEFATWRAARAVGDHDLNAFRMRLDPTGSIDGLEAGMTVWLFGQRQQ